MPDEFEGTPDHNSRLRDSINLLKRQGVTLGFIVSDSAAPISSSALSRFCSGVTSNIGKVAGAALWDYIQERHPVALHTPPIEDALVSADEKYFLFSKQFFDIKERRVDTFHKKFRLHYEFFVRSEIFYGEERIICGLLSFSQAASGALFVNEYQEYSGRFGPGAMTESYNGICLPKSGRNIFVMRRTTELLPKFYFITDYHPNPHDNRLDWFKGFMVNTTTRFNGYFQSNFYARRIASENEARMDIMEKEEIGSEHIRKWIFNGE